MQSVDLTPFGFTQTESLAYAALLERGPLGGYALAKALSIARANAYQALDGLAAKRAVSPTGERPQRYRPLQPSALLALIVERQTAQLDRLEQQLGRHEDAGTPGAVAISSRRALEELALRTAARSPGELTCVGPGWLVEALSPAWHKRAADGSPSRSGSSGTRALRSSRLRAGSRKVRSSACSEGPRSCWALTAPSWLPSSIVRLRQGTGPASRRWLGRSGRP